MASSTPGVVSCPEPLAAQAGAEILRQGGNALDAAIATALAQGVANPNMCGLGGVGGLVFHDSRTGETTFVSSTSSAPRKATPEMWADMYDGRTGTTWQVKGKRNLLGYQAQLVPGLLRALEHAFRRFGSGRVSWADLFAPAIRIAEEGYDVPVWLWEKWKPGGNIASAGGFPDAMPFLSFNRAAAEIYAPRGRALRPGERLVQKDYGNTLRRIAAEGAEVFYTGEIARAIAEDFAKNDGLIVYEDLRDVRAKELPALTGSYRQYKVCTSHAPSLGPTFLEMANILEGYDLWALGWNTPKYLDLLSRVMLLAYSDRLRHIADPEVYPVPVDRLTSKGYAAELRALIDSGRDSQFVEDNQAAGPDNTTSLTTLDAEGNAVSLVHSSNVGAGIVTQGLGFLWNSHMWMFNPLPGYHNSIAPGHQPISGTSAYMFLLDNRPVLMLSSPGGSRGTASCLQVACNVLEFGMDPQAAVSAGRIFAEDRPGVIRVDEGIPAETQAALTAMGRRIEVGRNGIASASYRDVATGDLMGGTDPRSGAGIAVVE